MKYKVAIVDNDELYLGRICRIFGEKYADKLTIYSYTSVETYQEGKESNRFDLVLYAEGIIAPQDIPQGVPAAFFVGQNDINKVDDFPAISKFQKHEMMLKQMMDLCLDRENTHYTKKNALGNITKVLLVTAAKGGIHALTHALAVSLSGKARVNSISPGWIDVANKEYKGSDTFQHPVQRVGKPEDIASMVLFLCSEESGFITGENICIDGGMTHLMIYHDDQGWTYQDDKSE